MTYTSSQFTNKYFPVVVSGLLYNLAYMGGKKNNMGCLENLFWLGIGAGFIWAVAGEFGDPGEILGIVAIFLVAAVVIYFGVGKMGKTSAENQKKRELQKYENELKEASNEFYSSAVKLTMEHIDVLRQKRIDLVFYNEYGKIDESKWKRELRKFINSIILKETTLPYHLHTSNPAKAKPEVISDLIENINNIIVAEFPQDLIKTKKAKKTRTRKPIPSKVKDEVWNRDGGQCVQCGSKENLEFDHIIPHSRGGADTVRNLQLLCEHCNRSKSANIG